MKTNFSPPVIQTERLIVRMAAPDEAQAIVDYYKENADHLAPSSSKWPPGFFEREHWEKQAILNRQEFEQDLSMRTFIYEKNSLRPATGDDCHAIIGSINISGIMRRAAQFCYLGYGLSRHKEGQGYMTEALRQIIPFVFDQLNVHRIMANYMPHNWRSANVLRKLGFRVEGFAREYLYLNGTWEDHVLTSLTSKNWKSDCN